MSKTRIDQFLFLNIVRQSYEAHYAWTDWLEKYRNESETERYAYETFSSRIKSLIGKGTTDEEKIFINMKVLDLWLEMSEQEKDRLIRESNVYKDRFKNVQYMMEMYSHTMM